MPKRRLALKMSAFELPLTLETLDGKANFSIFYRQTHNRPEIVHAPDASKIMDNNRRHRDRLIIRTIPSDYFLTKGFFFSTLLSLRSVVCGHLASYMYTRLSSQHRPLRPLCVVQRLGRGEKKARVDKNHAPTIFKVIFIFAFSPRGNLGLNNREI